MEEVTLQMKLGAIKGRREDGVCAFLGVPYAAPPVGELRFQKTQPHPGWQGVLDATEFGPGAWQNKKSKRPYSEDCLYLNIWTPEKPGKGRAVMFFIHGGSFAMGSGSDEDINGAKIARNGDVVFVTINYRLNVLGFLDFSFLDNDFVPNCGLYDMIEALKFVHENIEAFGGDPGNITVFGQSAGAISTSVLVTLPRANRYIARAIMMSGCPTLLHSRALAEEIGRKYLAFAGVGTAQELRSLPAEKLALCHSEFSGQNGMGVGTFMIARDGELVEEYPIQALQKGRAKGIPILIGTTREELSVFLIKPLAALLDINGMMNHGIRAEEEEVTREIVSTYRHYKKRRGLMIGISDMAFRVASMWYAEAYSEYADAWVYRLDYAPPAMKVMRLYAVHSSDIPYVFGNFNKGLGRLMFLLAYRHKKRYMGLYREMQGDFCSFAKTGRLPWEPVHETDTTGKCYDVASHIDRMVPEETMAAYAKTNYRKRSFAAEGEGV